jgi:hypothetical protein
MRYLCIVHHDESWFDRATPDEMKQLDRDSLLYDKYLEAKGKLVVAEALQNSRTARLVRVRQKKSDIVDGPFAETKEQMIGFLLIEADSMDEAVEIAKGVPLAKTGTIEVREAFTVAG